MSCGTVKNLSQIDRADLHPARFLVFRLRFQLIHLLQLRYIQVPSLSPLMPDGIFQPRRHGHEGGVAVREGPDDPRPPPYLAVYPLDAAVAADVPPVLGR